MFERSVLDKALAEKKARVEMMIFFKGAKDILVERLKLSVIQNDIGTLCRAIASKL